MGGRSISEPVPTRAGRWGRGVAALLIALLLVIGIALAQRAGWLTEANRSIMAGLGTGRDTAAGPAITAIMQGLSALGGTLARIVLVVLLMSVLWKRGRVGDARWLLLAVVGGTLLNLGLKQVFAAPRPDLLPHLDIVRSYSFPSGHASGNLIFLGALAMIAGRRGVWACSGVLIFLIGFSRVWLGVHWPSDVLAGWTIGVGWLLFCTALPGAPRDQMRAT
ncbi:MAG: phosphatase PAP2 family protein [Sphingobium sp.]|nr:MAG: phosphatase PAP2 family protein [Sphingobium sp.]